MAKDNETIMSVPGNTNAIRTGNRTRRAGIALAECGPKYKGIYQSLKLLREDLGGHGVGLT